MYSALKTISKIGVLIGLVLFYIFHFLLIYHTSFNLSKVWFWNFSSYFTPFIVFVEILLFLFFLLKKKFSIYTVIPLVLVLLSWKTIFDTIQLNENVKDENALTILSYNAGMIPFASIADTAVLDTNVSNGLFDLLTNESPDVLCLQEFHNDYGEMNILKRLNEVFGYEYYVMAPVFLEQFRGYSGPIVMSKYPIVADYHMNFTEGDNHLNHLIAVDISVGDDTLRVVNVHLNSMSIRLQTEISVFENVSNIYASLKKGFQAQCSQVEESYEYVKNCPHKVVLCGDLNSFPYSFPYQFLKSSFTNTFDERGEGFGYTLNRFPYFVRIDNVFVSDEIDVKFHKVLTQYTKSDHFPVFVGLSLDERD